MQAHETFKSSRPRVGQPITYQGGIAGNVLSVEGNLCWTSYASGSAPFIWAFKDGLNNLHDWPGKDKTLECGREAVACGEAR